MDQVTLPNAGGIDFITDAAGDPDDTMRWRRRGDAFPRVLIDPYLGSVKIGNGTVPPSAIAGGSSTAGGAAPTIDVRDYQIYPSSDARFVSAAVNTFAFAVLEQSIAGSCDFLFVAGDWPTQGFTLSKSGHRIIGAGGRAGMAGKGTRFYLTGGGSACVRIEGSDAGGGYGSRVLGCGISGVYMENQGPTATGLRIKHASLAMFQDVYTVGFRADGGGVYAYNFADSFFLDCAWEFCGSADQTDKAVIKFTGAVDGGETPRWAVDAIRFIECRWENNSDRLLDFREGNGFQVNKIFFFGCKFENSVNTSNGLNGSSGATQAQVWLDNCSHIAFDTCDFTLQQLAPGAPTPLSTIFRCKQATSLHLNGVNFHLGAGGMPKCFTNYFVYDNINGVLALNDVWVNSGSAGAFPTAVLAATNTPKLAQRNIGFTPTQGSGKVAADWFTAAQWCGVHAGAPSASGVIA